MAGHANSLRTERSAQSTPDKVPAKSPRPARSTPAVRPSPVQQNDPAVKLRKDAVTTLQERRRRRRADVPPMYSSVIVRVLSRKGAPIEGHVLNLSENGMAVELDYQIPVGQPVTLEFRIAGLGRVVNDQWSEFAAAAEVARIDDLDDFPQGPYRIALKFVRISTMAQAQIARYVATHPG